MAKNLVTALVPVHLAPEGVWRATEYLLHAALSWGSQGCLTEDEYIATAITFANTGSKNSVLALLGGSTVPWIGVSDSGETDYGEELSRFKQYLAEFVSVSERLRSDKKYCRAAVVKSVSTEVRTEIAAGAANVISILKPSLNTAPLRFRRIPKDLWSALAYVLQLLLRPETTYGDNLCRCNLNSCGIFFTMERKSGRPRRLYCTAKHLHEAHSIDARDRVRRYRERQKQARMYGRRASRLRRTCIT